MTFEEARHQLETTRDAIPSIVDEGRRLALREALDEVRAAWPVGETGESRDAWYEDGRGLVNPLPYVPYVHDGLADELAPAALRDAEPLFHDHVQNRVAALTGS